LKELKVVKDDLLLPEFENGEENDLIKPKSQKAQATINSFYKIYFSMH
jgi:hypothetical protein